MRTAILTTNNNEMNNYYKDGQRYIEGRPDSEFKIKVYNNSSSRKLYVISVDGLNIIDGNPADYSGPGYIVNPYDTMVIDGWRINNNKIRKFFFTNLKKSYTYKTGQNTNNNGVIGIAEFEEKRAYVPKAVYWNNKIYSEAARLDMSYGSLNATLSATANCSGYTRGLAQNLGTGMGEASYSKAVSGSFNREAQPREVNQIYYLTYDQLRHLGIIPFENVTVKQAFPGQFCKEV